MAETTVTVTSCKSHTFGDDQHVEGSVYQAPADQVDNLVAQGLVTVGGAARAARLKAAAVAGDAPVTRTTAAVAPLTTDASPLVTPKARNRTTAAPRATKAKAKAKARR